MRRVRPVVLVVDDNEVDRYIVRSVLERNDYLGQIDLYEAEDVLAVRKLLRQGLHRVDLAIVDYAMPFSTGVEVAQELQAAFPDILAFLLTGFIAVDEVVESEIDVVAQGTLRAVVGKATRGFELFLLTVVHLLIHPDEGWFVRKGTQQEAGET